MSKRIIDLTGQVFGELTVVKQAAGRVHGRVRWECVCSCGKAVVVDGVSLRRGVTQSCGHLRGDAQRARADRHGGSHDPEHGAWTRMIAKCVNVWHPQYALYGARGVKVCDRWTASNGDGYRHFITDVGRRPDAHHVLALVDEAGDFEPGNVHWVPRAGRPMRTSDGEPARRYTSTPEYHALYGAIQRCTKPGNPHYAAYGGRGIKVCDRWTAPGGEGYSNFLADMGQRPGKGWSLDRVDVNGNYEPSNCRWATRAQQANNRQASVYVEAQGVKRTVAEWAQLLNVPPKRIMARLVAYPDGPATRWLFPGKLYGMTPDQLAAVDAGAWLTGDVHEVAAVVRCVDTGDCWRTASEVEFWTGVNQAQVSAYLRGEPVHAGGLRWITTTDADALTRARTWPVTSTAQRKAVLRQLGGAPRGHGLGGGAGKRRQTLGSTVIRCVETGELYASGLTVEALLHIPSSTVRHAVLVNSAPGGLHFEQVPTYMVDTSKVHMLPADWCKPTTVKSADTAADAPLMAAVRDCRARYATLTVRKNASPKTVDVHGDEVVERITGHVVYQVIRVTDGTVVASGHTANLHGLWRRLPATRGLDPAEHAVQVVSVHATRTAAQDALAVLRHRTRLPRVVTRPEGITAATLNSWKAMCMRCLNPRSPSYAAYGGRGVKICNRWTEDETGVRNFLADMGNAPPGCTLDRIDVNGDYCPANCRWATAEQQQANKRRTVHSNDVGQHNVNRV